MASVDLSRDAQYRLSRSPNVNDSDRFNEAARANPYAPTITVTTGFSGRSWSRWYY